MITRIYTALIRSRFVRVAVSKPARIRTADGWKRSMAGPFEATSLVVLPCLPYLSASCLPAHGRDREASASHRGSASASAGDRTRPALQPQTNKLSVFCRNFRCDCGNRKFTDLQCKLHLVSVTLTVSLKPSTTRGRYNYTKWL